MDPGLKLLQQQIESAHAGMTPKQLSWHLLGKWSAADVLEHLYLTYTGTIKGFGRVLAAGKPLVTASSWTHRGRQLVVLGFRHMPTGRPSPAAARPRGLPLEKVQVEIGPTIVKMDEIITDCERRLGRGKLLDHPILGPLSPRQWRLFHLVHGLHHVRQIAELKQRTAELER
jgi:Protein of unknown function (DUF1569)